MGDYVDIGGHSTWVEVSGNEEGDAETVLALHGGISNSDDLLAPLGPALAEVYRVVAFDRRGHGRTADTDAPFHYHDMATEAIGVLEAVVGGAANLVGWSDGGIVALLVALRRPDLVRRLVLIGANFHYNGVRPLDVSAEVLDMIRAAFVERSPDGPDHFDTVLGKAMATFTEEPTLTSQDLEGIAAPALVLVGDDDLVELGHTCELYESLSAGQLAVIPGASHLVPMEKPAQVSATILEFLAGPDIPQTLMPCRRAAAADTATP